MLAGRQWVGATEPGTPAARDAILMYYDQASNRVMADYRNASGRLVRYRLVPASARSVQFVSEAGEGGPIYRLTYERSQPELLNVRLESAQAAYPEAFSTIAISRLHRDILVKPLG